MESVEQLSGVRCRTVIINVHTDLITARALLSALAHNALPVLVINCDPTEASRKVFETLMSTYEFDLIEAPLALHGTTLDWVFSSLPDERVLLLDSDAEIRKDGFVEWMGDKLDHGLCFGAGFLWGPFLIDEEWKSPPGAEILYMERPWIPCVMLKVEPVRSALAAGVSFNATWTPNEFSRVPRLAKFLGARWGPPWGLQSRKFSQLPGRLRERMATEPLDVFRWARRPYNGFRPHMVVRDTGGEIYEHLRYRAGLSFAGTPIELSDGEVHHYLGVTRHVLHGPHALDTKPEDVAEEVIARLATVYGYQWKPS